MLNQDANTINAEEFVAIKASTSNEGADASAGHEGIIKVPTSIEAIKALRNKTGAGINVCKKALEECNNDENAAIHYIVKKGMAKQKQAGFSDAGYVGVSNSPSQNHAVLVEVMAQTDFVAKSSNFRTACDDLAVYIANNIDQYREKIELTKSGTWITLEDFRDNEELLNKFISMGESFTIGRCHVFEKSPSNDFLYHYIHSNSPTNVYFAMVQLRNDSEYGDDIAKHIALYAKESVDEMLKASFIGDDTKSLSDVLNYKDDLVDVIMGKVGHIHIINKD
jgi:elongation factor Ts